MVTYSNAWSVKQSKVMTEMEIDSVIGDLVPKSRSSRQILVKLVIFRLATYCGLRVTEMTLLNMDDVRLDCEQPFIRIRAETSKGNKAREVPIYSEGTVSDLRAWIATRAEMDSDPGAPFLVSVSKDAIGNRFSRQGARLRFQSACRSLGEERAKGCSIHFGRHTACSFLLSRGVPITTVRNLMGHSSISVTNVYSATFVDRAAKKYTLD
jgi:site-specific recombinase XerD